MRGFGWLLFVTCACGTETAADVRPTQVGAGTPAPEVLPSARAPVALLSGAAIFRPECFESANEGGGGLGLRGVGKGGGGLGSGYGGPSGLGGNAQGGPPSPAAPSPVAAAPPASRPVDGARAKKEEGRVGKSDSRKPMAEPTEPASLEAEDATRGDRDERRRGALDDVAAAVREGQPALDWGATVWLSNDDSMSLASAQRIIWNAQQGMPTPAREIRPHELLNYFSFDTKEPEPGETFGVLAAARQTGDRLTVALAVRGATPERAPLDLTFVVDRSGSMREEGRMDYTKRGLHVMEKSLSRGDRVDLVLFDDTVCTPLENYVVGRDDPALLTRVIDGLEPRGGTNMGIGLTEGYAVARRHEQTNGRNRRMMVVTDAMVNQGNLDEASLTDVAKAYDAEGIRVTGIGVGRGFNDKVLNQLTEKGKGAYVYLGSEAVVDRVFGTSFPSLVQTIAHEVHFAIDLPESLGMERFYGEEASTTKEDVQPIHYYAGTTQLFLQDLRIRDGKVAPDQPVALRAEWRDARTGEPLSKSWQTTVGALLESDPRNVDKGLALMAWTDVLFAEATGADPCGAPASAYAERSARLTDDAELAFVNGLVQKRCPAYVPRVSLVAKGPHVPFKVKIDADIPIAEVALACADQRWTDAISAADTVARFDATPGTCTLTLSGAVEMAAQVEVPATGGDTRCVVRGGRFSCG